MTPVNAMTRIVEEKGERIAAFFDLDGTLLGAPSIEKRFFRVLRYQRRVSPENYWAWLTEALRTAPLGMAAVIHGNKMYLRDVAAGDAALMPNLTFFTKAFERVAWHARQGHSIALVSGTLEPLAQRAAALLEAQLSARGLTSNIIVRGTRVEEVDGRWTGRLVDAAGEAMFGEEKARTMRGIARQLGIDPSRCYAYGNSASDRWLLAAAGFPAAVNPSDELARLAVTQGWPVMWWREQEAAQTREIGREARTGVSRPAISQDGSRGES